jgi:hypothetical protein
LEEPLLADIHSLMLLLLGETLILLTFGEVHVLVKYVVDLVPL